MASGLDQWLGKLEGHNEIGEALTEQLQKAEEEVQQFVGGGLALKLGSDKVGALGSIVDEDLKAGLLSFESELKAAEYVKKTIIRAREILANMAESSKAREIAAAGKVSALKESRDLVLRHCKAAMARAEQLKLAKEELEAALSEDSHEEPPEGSSEEQRGRNRASGRHPGPSRLDGRRVDSAKDKLKSEVTEESNPTPKKGRPRKKA